MSAVVRRGVRVRGVVQGVGFRPHVFALANELGLSGRVLNDGDGVWLELEGDAAAVDLFASRLVSSPPPLAKIISLEQRELATTGARGFEISKSISGGRRTAVAPDSRVCDDCLRELRDPHDRRYRYPFINCTNCGPRYTIVRDVPYDRPNTSMSSFLMCDRCRREYEDPADRRFHAQPVACPACGPSLWAEAPGGRRLDGDALERAGRVLRGGGVVALRGLGGFQLACDARDEAAVSVLRQRKLRFERPFALMAKDEGVLRATVEVDDHALRVLGSASAPVLLLPRARGCRVARSVAPGVPFLGVMLPTTPMHVLLFDFAPPLLVMTSGNASEEPIAIGDDEARVRLSGMCDLFVMHDRDVLVRCDDSVVMRFGSSLVPVRRARGIAPSPIPLSFDAGRVLAVGPHQKNTVCFTRGREAVVSQHVGDLDNEAAFAFFEETIDKLGRILDVKPDVIACDLHPDYLSTRWAEEQGTPVVRVQHHHAHVASVLAEHGLEGPAIGLALDGTGYGEDGTIWGGEVLRCDLRSSERLGHLALVPLPGGEAAVREPWRVAAAHLFAIGEPSEVFPAFVDRVGEREVANVLAMLRSGVNCPPSSGLGRLFDSAASLCGVRDRVVHEGHAAAELEARAWRVALDDARLYPFSPDDDAPFVLDPLPLLAAMIDDLKRGVPVEFASSSFHRTLVEGFVAAAVLARRRTGLDVVALSGGCMMNALFGPALASALERVGFRVLVHRLVPPNDGGVSLGQAAVAAVGSAG